MLPSDHVDFSKIMINCFQNFRAAISTAMVDEWFDELKGFDFFHIGHAFRKYTNENERYAPTRAAIINLAKKNATKLQSDKNNSEKCYVSPCDKIPEYRRGNKNNFGKVDDIFMCKDHDELWILKMLPNSLEAEMIKRSKKIEADAKLAGLSNREYFKQTNPKAFAAVQKSMREVHKARDNTFAVEDYLSGG